MGSKTTGFERFLAPSINKIEDKLDLILGEIDSLKARMGETDNRFKELEGNYRRLESRVEKVSHALPPETEVLINNVGDMEKQDRDEIEALKRFADVAQRRLAILEAKMKELGK